MAVAHSSVGLPRTVTMTAAASDADDVYRRAAAAGDLDRLRRGSRRNFDRADGDDGMTATLTAAAVGQLTALKLMVERG